MRAATWVLALALAGVLAVIETPRARAEVVTYETRGRADEGAADPRTQALDVAFAAAVTEAVADLAGPAARVRAAEVDREIIKRARRYVASFQVRAQTTDGGRLELEVAVRVDLDKVRTRLVELGVALRSRDVDPAATAPRARTATVLLRVTGAGPPAASFGAAASTDVPGLARLGEALASAGFAAVPASAAGPAPGSERELPVDDAGARALAGDVRADVVVIVGVQVGEVGPVRGVPLRAAPATARLRVLDVKTGAVLDDVTVASGAWGTDERLVRVAAEAATAAAASAAWARRAPAPAPAGPGAITAAAGITVRVTGEQPWAAATAIRARLTGAPGVSRVTWAGVGDGEVALAVVGATAAKVAGQIKTADGVAGRVTVAGDVVEVALP